MVHRCEIAPHWDRVGLGSLVQHLSAAGTCLPLVLSESANNDKENEYDSCDDDDDCDDAGQCNTRILDNGQA